MSARQIPWAWPWRTATRIDRELGAGGMATVYFDQDLRHDRKVAVTVLKSELATVPGGSRPSYGYPYLQYLELVSLYDSGKPAHFSTAISYVQGEASRALERTRQLRVVKTVRTTLRLDGIE